MDRNITAAFVNTLDNILNNSMCVGFRDQEYLVFLSTLTRIGFW